MKKLPAPLSSVPISLLSCLILFSALGLHASAQVTEAEKKLISEASRATYKFKATSSPIKHAAIEQVFKGKPFSVRMEIHDQKGRVASGLHWVLLHEGKILPLKKSNQLVDVPAVKGLIRDDFRLRTEADTEIFQAMLLKVGETGFEPDQDDIDAREIIKTEQGWTFVTGEAFKKRKGHVVSTDADGVILGIERTMDIPAKQK